MSETAQRYINFIEAKEASIVLVSGANSATGSFLIEELLKLKCKVIGIDEIEKPKTSNLSIALSSPNFSYFTHNLSQDNLKFKEEINYIFHLSNLEQDDTREPLAITKILELTREKEAKFLLATSLNLWEKIELSESGEENYGPLFKSTDSFVEQTRKYTEAMVAAYYKKLHLDLRIIRLLDLYGPRMKLNQTNHLTKLFHEALQKKPLTVGDDGLNLLYPTFIKDATDGILKAMFGYETKGFVFNLVNPEPISVLSFAQILEKELSGEGRILMVKDSQEAFSWQKRPKSSAKELAWNPETSNERGIRETLSFFDKDGSFSKEEEQKIFPDLPNNPPSVSRKIIINKKLTLVIVLCLLFLLLLFSPALYLFLIVKKTQSNLQLLERQIASQNLTEMSKITRELFGNVNGIQRSLSIYSPAFSLVGKEKEYQETEKILSLTKDGVSAAMSLIEAAADFNDVTKTVFSQDQEGGVSLKIIDVKKNLDEANNKLSYIQSQIPNINIENSFLKGKINREKIVQRTGQFLKGRLMVSRARELIDILPEVLGLLGKRTYLILFSNNMEQRPAGGFIGSYGILTFDKGKMVELKVEDVYTADGQLTGHIEPPRPIREYLEQPHWYLRDSNWSPDFLLSAQKAEWFLDKEVGRKADGVFSVDLNAIADLVRVVGPINLPDYQETITAKNLFEKATFYSQENFFPGSTQKRDFLGALSRRLLDKLLLEGTKNSPTLLSSLLTSLEEKHLAFFFHDESAENLMSRFNWAGRLSGDPCLEIQDCLGDYLMVVDANLGVNKANVGIAKKIQVEAELTGSSINKTITLIYQNNNSAESFQKGRYKNYLRVYQPLNTQLESISLDGQEREIISTTSATIKNSSREALLVDKSSEGKNSFGFLTEIAPGVKLTIVMKLNTGGITLDQNKNYRLVVQKQLGAQNEDYFLAILPPRDFVIESIPKEVNIKDNKIMIEERLLGDRVFNFNFQKQETN